MENTNSFLKKSIGDILSLKKVPKETMQQAQQLSDEEKNELIKELIGAYNFLLTFYQNAQSND